MNRREGDVYSPTLNMDLHEGSEAEQVVELKRMMLYHGFQTLIDDNTPILESHMDHSSLSATVKTDSGDKTINLSCDKLRLGPSCWGPDSVPLEIRVFLPENPEYFVIEPLGKGKVLERPQGLLSPQVVRDMNLGDILRLETILSHINRPGTKIDYHYAEVLTGF